MPRCQSWRPVAGVDDSHTGHVPGDCRVCWRPCFARVDPGQVRCTECTLALRDHMSEFIRTALAAEPSTPESVLRFLADDNSLSVSSMAERALARRRGA